MAVGEKVQVIVPPEMASRWRAAAEAAGLSLSTWVREEVQRRENGSMLDELLQRTSRIERLVVDLKAKE